MPIIVSGITSSLNQLDNDQKEFIEKELRERALRAFADVKLATPVDEGTARNSWLIGYNVSYTSDGSAGIEILTQRDEPTEITITNGTSYINFLNQGSSVQAPTAFIEQAFRRYFDSVQIDYIDGERN